MVGMGRVKENGEEPREVMWGQITWVCRPTSFRTECDGAPAGF